MFIESFIPAWELSDALWVVPCLTGFIRSVMAFNEPQNWDADLLPRQVERDTEDMGSTTRGKLLTRLMSAYMNLFYCQAIAFTSLIKRDVQRSPGEKLGVAPKVGSLLVLADIYVCVHRFATTQKLTARFVFTLWHLPPKLRFKPGAWTLSIRWNVLVTPMLLLSRWIWYLQLAKWESGIITTTDPASLW